VNDLDKIMALLCVVISLQVSILIRQGMKP